MTEKPSRQVGGIQPGPSDDIHAETLTPKERFTLQVQANQSYLAWVRTSIAILGLGLVLAKLALWVRWTAQDTDSKTFLEVQEALGISLLVGGTLLVAVMTIVHKRSYKTIKHGRLPETPFFPVYLLSGLIALVGILLTALVIIW